MIGHELTTRWHLDHHVDHPRSLAIVQPSLLRNQIQAKRAKLEQMGKNVFALEASKDLGERTIDAIETIYQDLGLQTQLSEHKTSKALAIDTVLAQ